jgi:hypothetical protein
MFFEYILKNKDTFSPPFEIHNLFDKIIYYILMYLNSIDISKQQNDRKNINEYNMKLNKYKKILQIYLENGGSFYSNYLFNYKLPIDIRILLLKYYKRKIYKSKYDNELKLNKPKSNLLEIKRRKSFSGGNINITSKKKKSNKTKKNKLKTKKKLRNK